MFQDLLHLFFPKKCVACEENLVHKEMICTSCLHQLPLANTHLNNENTLKKVFNHEVDIKKASCLLYYYKKGITQRLFHNLKYRGQEEISSYLAEWFTPYLEENNFMTGIDGIIPVPLHRSRLKERGYNQVEGFAKTLATNFNKVYIDDVLIKKEATKTQVFKNRLARQKIKPNYFSLEQESKIENKHILLCDDIVTTGATMKNCIQVLQVAKNVKISIASMAYAI
ncbi:ComF family protein [Mesonia oceanica]|uniref:Uncharacterized protein n=1 Tax=Mesonia oceanica TaxID=2687242 RepID=A0AC61Y3Y2_9FLAO|nr:phosphoribosyltransferase family protein [Mesonia oceanica]MAQ41703.1 amidophosphoribosyltransferase [Mesonia sp.]MBJ96557.1 amidophosphoribosyltransferase [Flavobacteriaceae bacterium]VVU99117.1 hypothetical protein FVB9532_00369 [Mesonia oceanica]